MKADFSRLSFDELQHYVGVVHQQGRVWLDSDWNDDVFERLRLLEQETVDIVGSCGVPKPHTAFKIEPPAAGTMDDFVIRGGLGSRGHYYVDGLLAQLERDATYRTQPDYPDPPSLTVGEDGIGQHGVVYLEVWQRLITHVEDPTLKDVALGGPDTTGRVKTVAQVKVLTVPASAGALTCEDADRLLAQTGGGTLRTLPPTDTPPDDDCEIPDPGSYTGRENRLYRVEVHDAGDVVGGAGGTFNIPLNADAAAGSLTLTLARSLSTAEAASIGSGVITVIDDLGQRETLPVERATGATVTLGRGLEGRYRVADRGRVLGGAAIFKWSRDNAAFASAVTAVADDRTTLSLDSLGRDVITTLRDGDLVEVADDVSDLGPARGHLTTLVADPEADPPRVTLAQPLPARFTAPGGGRPDRHLKLRRWDGLGMAQATFDPIVTPDMNLGDGVRIQFGGAGLRPGDYWTFAARRADGSVERLDAAAPQGILRRRCALAIVRWGSTDIYPLQVVEGAVRRAYLGGDLFGKIYALLLALGNAGTKEIDEATVVALATEAGATPAQLDAIREKLRAAEGTRRSPRLEVVDDCRSPFDPLTDLACGCECTVAVEPGESIEAAVRRVPAGGGTICLLPGTHDLRRPVAIRGRRAITIRGSGAATQVRAIGLSTAFRFEDCDMVAVRDLVLLGGPIAEVHDVDERRRRVIELLGDAARRPEVLDPAVADFDAGNIGATTEERLEAASSVAPEESGTRPDAFPGLITFLDCRGTTVAGCSLLYAPPGSERSRPGFGLVFVDSAFLKGEMAPGVRRAVMAVRGEEGAPVAEEPAPAPMEGRSPVAPPAPMEGPAPAAPPAPMEGPAPAEAPAAAPAEPERPREVESPALAGISALIAAMGDRAPSISPLRAENVTMRTADTVSAERLQPISRAGRPSREAVRRERPAAPERASATDESTFVPLEEARDTGLVSILATIGRETVDDEVEAMTREPAREVPVAEHPIAVLAGELEQPVAAVPVSEAMTATAVPVSDHPIRVETMTADTTEEPRRKRRPVDLAVRDCRFFSGNGESGALVASAIGVTVTNDWFLPLEEARQFGFDTQFDALATRRSGKGFGVLLVDDRIVTIRDNVIVDHTFGLAVVDLPTGKSAVAGAPAAIQVVGNVIASRSGPALWAVSRDADLVLVDNAMTGEPVEGRQTMLGLAEADEHGATADVTADTVVAIGNRFGCGGGRDAVPTHAVGMKAGEIIFSSNQSVCDTLPSKANVVLRSGLRLATRQNNRAGRITAVSNLCSEPRQIVRGDFRLRFEEVLGNLALDEERRVAFARLVAEAPSDDLLITRLRRRGEELEIPPELTELVDAADREVPQEESIVALRKELEELDDERSTHIARYMVSEATAADIQPALERLTARQLAVEERIRVIEAVNKPPQLFSLVAIAATAVTGMNVLSHGLLRSGTGSDTGTVQNVP